MLAALVRLLGVMLLPVLIIGAVSTYLPVDVPTAGSSTPAAPSSVLLIPGLSTDRGILEIGGTPMRRFPVDGDEFWLYSLKSRADFENVAALQRGEPCPRNMTSAAVRLEDVAILRLDGKSRVLKAVCRHEEQTRLTHR